MSDAPGARRGGSGWDDHYAATGVIAGSEVRGRDGSLHSPCRPRALGAFPSPAFISKNLSTPEAE